MAKDGISIEIDKASRANLERQFSLLGTTIDKASPKAIFKVLMKIRSYAMLRLTGMGHVVTSRLKNSIYVEMGDPRINTELPKTYTDESEPPKSYNAELKTVRLKENEGAVGTNVSYAAGIEFGFAPHVIRAKDAKVLGTPKTGFFGKQVNHPGFAGDSYLYWALKNVDVTSITGEDLREVVNNVANSKFRI
jgi:hypothetical protein